jgi:hypothetical protein
MKYRVTVFFGRYRFQAFCENVAVAFRHAEAIICSPLFISEYGPNVGNYCAGIFLQLAEMERGERRAIWNDVFCIERIGKGPGK